MPTLYCDLDNGNDNYGGTSFALLAQGTNGRITSATFSATGASFPNDGSLIGQYLSIFNGTSYVTYNITAWVSATSLTIAQISGGTALANQSVDRQYFIGGRWKSLTSGATAARLVPGDTVRMMGSPAPTSLGQNGVWTSQALQSTKNITSSTNATPISVTCSAHGYITGDTVVITGHATNTNANGTWEITVTGANTFTLDGSAGNGTGGATGTVRLRNNSRVMLASAITQNIASTGPGRAAWVSAQGTAVVHSFDTTNFKEHNRSDSFQSFVSTTTGLMAYYTLPSTLDLSGFQQVAFWFYHSSGSGNADFELRLCSDSFGAVTVNTIDVPIQSAIRKWTQIIVDLGSNLGSNINSVGLYSVAFNGAQTFLLNNIIACKASSAADSLTLSSLIGKNTTGETFWGIQSINGRRVMLDADTNATPASTSVRGYYGSSETVTTWKRETIKLGPSASGTTALQQIQKSGTDGNLITFSGGWDRTAMSTQNLETWLDGVNGNGVAISLANQSFLLVSGFAYVRVTYSYNLLSSYLCSLQAVAVNNCSHSSNLGFIQNSSYRLHTFVIGHAVANSEALQLSGASSVYTITHYVASSPGGIAFMQSKPDGVGSKVQGASSSSYFANHANSDIAPAGTITIDKLRLLSTINFDVSQNGQLGGTYYANNCEFSTVSSQSFSNVTLFSQQHDRTSNNHKIFIDGALISTATDQRYTASGISWKIQPTSTNRSSTWPVVLSLAKVAVAANSLVTVSAWMRRDNSGLSMRLVVKGGQIAGVPNDLVAAMTTTNAWEQEIITFTPTETGVVEITAEAWGGATFSGWVDAMAISQA